MAMKSRATWVLAFFAALTLIGRYYTICFPESLAWGLLYHGALAATVGGLADWFAVTALFRRPLGIAWRTEILKKNRARIMEALVAFCGKDLLGQEEIAAVIRREDMSALLTAYLKERGGQAKVIAAIEAAAIKTLAAIDIERLARELSPVISRLVGAIPTDKIVAAGLTDIADGDSAAAIAGCIAKVGQEVYVSPDIQRLISQEAELLRDEYTDGKPGRAMALGMANFTPERLVATLNDAAAKNFREMAEPGTAENQKLSAWLAEKLTDDSFVKPLSACFGEKKQALASPEKIAALLSGIMRQSIFSAPQSNGSVAWREAFRRLAGEKIDEFCQNSLWQKEFDAFIKDYLLTQLAAHHDFIIKLIRQRLDALTDEALIELAESYVANDLQIIRINGSLVGGLVGAALFLAVRLLEGVWGA